MAAGILSGDFRAIFGPNASRFNGRPLLDAMREVNRDDLVSSSALDFPKHILDSNVFVNLCTTSVKNFPFAFRKQPLELKDWKQGLETRLRYTEMGMMSYASLVHNVVLGVLFGALTIVTFGQLVKVRELCAKYFTHAALAAGSVAVSTLGTVLPKAGITAHLVLCGGIVLITNKMWIPKFIQKTRDFYVSRRERLKEAVIAGVEGGQEEYQTRFAPVFDYFDRTLDRGITPRMDIARFIDIFVDGGRRYPQLMEVVIAVGKEWFKAMGEDIELPTRRRR